MYSQTPRLEIFTRKIEENARVIIDRIHASGATVACVTKVACANPAVAKALRAGGADMIADSRILNLQSLGESGINLPLMLLRIPTPSHVADIVKCADYSLNSSVVTVEKLSEAAQFFNVIHKVIIMVDIGDLREGVWPDKVNAVVKSIANLPNIAVVGLGCNLACYGGVIPNRENMQVLVDIRDECRRVVGLELPVLSGANSAGLPVLFNGEMPREINHYRIGETILLGRNVIDRSLWPGTHQDTFRLVAEVVELEQKPSIPIGKRGQDAFGETVNFVDRGIRRRAICNIGRQDVSVDGITPEDSGIIVLGGSSDHLILDVEEAHQKISLGSEIGFYPGYGALLAAATSRYVQNVIIED
jgi:predicted amino acid racemase